MPGRRFPEGGLDCPLTQSANHASRQRADKLSLDIDIIAMIATILKHQGLPEQEIRHSSTLYDEGIGLDSLCVAELSAMLEKTYGRDPYTSKQLPMTVQDIVDFYGGG